MKSVAIPVQQLNSFELEVSELIKELLETFASKGDDHDGQKSRHALARYKKRVVRVGLIAGKFGLIGLHDVCVEFQKIIKKLEASPQELSDVEYELLEEWPILVMYYISSPDQSESAEGLIRFIQRPEWQVSVADKEVEDIRGLLDIGSADDAKVEAPKIQDVAAQAEADQPTKEREIPYEQPTTDAGKEIADNCRSLDSEAAVDVGTVPSDIQKKAAKSEARQSTDESAFEDEQPSLDAGTVASLKAEATEAMDDCLTNLNLQDDESSIASNADTLTLCAARIELLGMSVAMTGFMGLMDACLLFQGSLKELASRADALTSAEVEVLKGWTQLFSDYLDDPESMNAAESLVDYLRTITWTDVLNDDDAQTLKELLVPEEIQLAEIPDGPDISAEEPESLEAGNQVENEIISGHTVQPAAENDSRDRVETTELPPTYLELLTLLSLELETTRDSLDSALATASSVDEETADRRAALRSYGEQLHRFTGAAETLGLDGLCQVFTFINNNLAPLIEQDNPLRSNETNLFSGWFEKVTGYLADPLKRTSCQALGDYLAAPQWLSGLSETQLNDLVDQLGSPEIVLEEEEIEPRQTIANPEDVSLDLPEDVNQQLLDSLLQELPHYTADFTGAITRIAQGEGQPADVDIAQRIAHTIKGSANTVGVVGLATLTHHIEDILQAFSKAKCLPGKKLADVLLNAADVLEMMSEKLLGIGSTPEQSQAVLQEILDWANQIDTNGISEEDVPRSALPVEQQSAPEHGTSQENTRTVTETASQTATPTLRVPATLVDELLRLVGESFILGGQLSERLRNVEHESLVLRKQNTMLQQLTYELEQIVDVQGVTAARRRDSEFEEFDALELDQYNELHTITRQLVEAATDAREMTQGVEDQLTSVEALLASQGWLHKDTQEVVIQTRMVPVQNIVPRLQRAVRQTGRLIGKAVDIDISGAETLIDSDVLNDLTEPLMHILRNAVDHGIEPADRRSQLGKSESGLIKLDFFRSGDNIVVRCQDDGGGLDYERIHQRAAELGLVEEDHLVTDDELSRYILLPRFSTRDEVTQVSGRGMGMDVVQTKINQMKGSIHIESVRNQSSTVELRLPLTLISIHGLLVQINSQMIALSSRGVERIVHGEDGHFHYEGDKLIYTLADEQYDACQLETLFGLAASDPNTGSRERAVMLVKNDAGKTTAVRVGKVSASVDLVVKQLGPFVPDIPGLEGATILGDGGIAPVLDLVDLLVAGRINTLTPTMATETLVEEDSLPYALVVDDSLSARRSLAQFVEDVGLTVRTARDGLDAIEVMEEKTPDILLVDLEMPRMNGLELASHLRANAESKNIPIIMITSRSTEKHRRQAESAGIDVYLTKPFSEDELLGHIHSVLS